MEQALQEQQEIRKRAGGIVERPELRELTERQRSKLWSWIVSVGNGLNPRFE